MEKHKDDLERWATDYLNQGLSIIPLNDSKAPIVAWKEYQTRIATIKELQVWLSNPKMMGIGLVTGKLNGISVVDIDSYKDPKAPLNFTFPASLVSLTARGGNHYFYKYAPQADGIKSLSPIIDLRSEGNYVAVSPSKYNDGSQYRWLNLLHPQDLRSELNDFPINILPASAQAQQTPIVSLTEYFDDVPEGSRNNQAASFAGKLVSNMRQDLWEVSGWRTLSDWNEKMCSPPLPEVELRSVWESVKSLQIKSPSKLNSQPAKTNLDTFTPDKPSKIKILVRHLKNFIKKEVDEFPYLIDKLVPRNAITAITAATGKGKSLFAYILCKYLVEGDPLFGEFKLTKSKVLLIDQEMNESLIIDRFRAIYGEFDADNFDVVCEEFFKIDNDDHFQWLLSTVKANQYDVVIFDTLTSIHDVGENSSDEMKKVNERFLKLIKDCDVTVIFLHHNKKPGKDGGKDGLHMARGSTEIIAKAASHLSLKSIKDVNPSGEPYTRMTITQEKSRLPESIQDIELMVFYDPLDKKTRWEYSGAVSLGKTLETTARDFVMDILSVEGDEGDKVAYTIKEMMVIADENEKGFSEHTLRSAVSSLKRDTLDMEKVGRSHSYSLTFKGSDMASHRYRNLNKEDSFDL